MLTRSKVLRIPKRLIVWALCTIALPLGGSPQAASQTEFADARTQMVNEIRATAESIGRVGDTAGISQSVLDVMGSIPRHEFVPAGQRSNAYQDRPLPIGHGQTISQPYIVALMTALLRVQPNDVILEVGTGSGYQAAVLGSLAREVYTIEIIPALAQRAEETLNRLGYSNVTVREGDGYYGWPERSPFDGIIVTAGARHIPPRLIQQLKPGGRMVIPVGGIRAIQDLILVEKSVDGSVTSNHVLPVRFVPLTGQH